MYINSERIRRLRALIPALLLLLICLSPSALAGSDGIQWAPPVQIETIFEPSLPSPYADAPADALPGWEAADLVLPKDAQSDFTIDANGTLLSYSGAAQQLTIPQTVNGVTVRALGSYLFQNNTLLTAVVIPEGVQSIGFQTFSGCTALKSVSLPSTLTYFNNAVFYNCASLESISLPDSLTRLGTHAFYDCASLESISLPEGITTVDPSAFYGCTALTSIEIPAGVTEIGSSAFNNCASLQSVSLPEGLLSVGPHAFNNCPALADAALPASVAEIGMQAFYGCSSLQSIDIPSGVNSLGEWTFASCTALKSISLPEGLTAISSYTFYNCTALTSLTLPSSLRSIGEWTFASCRSIESLTLPEGVAAIPFRAFYYCTSLKSVSIPESILEMGECAFESCLKLTGISLPNGLTAIPEKAFYNCESLTSVSVPAALASIGAQAFGGCAFTEIRLPDSLEEIGDAALPGRVVLYFGTNPLLEEYAIANGLEYVCDGKTVTSEEIDTVEEKIDWVIANYTSSDMSEYQLALRLYDWLCANVVYDTDYLDDKIPTSPLGVGGEAALLDGIAVCHGFAESYEWLLEEVGITAYYVYGYANNGLHAWNIAEIEGEYYQFDPTWDEGGDGASHTYFGLSDMAMRSDHEQYSHTYIVCNSWDANYNYRLGLYDELVQSLASAINDGLLAGAYTGSIDVSSFDRPDSFWGRPDPYTVACMLSTSSDWAVEGRIELTPSEPGYSYHFYPDEVNVTSLSISSPESGGDLHSTFSMYPGQTYQLNAVTVPSGADVTFSSTDPLVVYVSDTGLLTARSAGSAIITASAGSISLDLVLEVRASDRFVLTFEPGQYITPEQTALCRLQDLNASTVLLPTANMLTWKSSNPSVAAVDENGLITPKSLGKTTVTLTDSCGTSFSSDVYVRYPVTSISVDEPLYEGTVGDEFQPVVRLEGCDQDSYAETFVYVWLTPEKSGIVEWVGYYMPTKEANGSWIYKNAVACRSVGATVINIKANDQSSATAAVSFIVHSQNPLLLPESLRIIDEEAFMGLTAEEIVLSDDVRRIGSRAFADCSDLKIAVLPDSLESIADDAFEGCSSVAIVGRAGTESHAFALRNGLSFVPIP